MRNHRVMIFRVGSDTSDPRILSYVFNTFGIRNIVVLCKYHGRPSRALAVKPYSTYLRHYLNKTKDIRNTDVQQPQLTLLGAHE